MLSDLDERWPVGASCGDSFLELLRLDSRDATIQGKREYRIFFPDGQIRPRFSAAKQEVITTPPAIGSDSSVRVGATKALHVAR